MHKSRYMAECQLRHPQLQRDLLAFHQQFPELFKRLRERPFKYLMAPPKELQDLFQFIVVPPSYLKIVPQTFNALHLLYSMDVVLCAHQLGYPRRLYPESSNRYFHILLTKSSTWKQEWKVLRSKWSRVHEPFLRYCQLADLHRPSLLIPTEPFSQEAWAEQASRAAHAAKLMIPIYEDTTEEEVAILWKQHIQHLKRWVYREPEEALVDGNDELRADPQKRRPERRQRPDQYDMRLKVWDSYQNYPNFSAIAQLMERRRSTVQGIYLQVSRDIFGPHRRIARTRQQRLLQDFDSMTHIARCTVCQKAQSMEEMCLVARTYACQDKRSQREYPYSNIDDHIC